MSRPITLLLTLLFFISSLAWGQRAYTPQMVPNVQLLATHRFVSDPEGRLSNDAIKGIDMEISVLREAYGVEISLVVLPAIQDDDPESFTEQLFSLWGIGKKHEDNGLLILYVYDAPGRLLRFEVGYGLEGVLPDALAYRIQQDDMIPLIRAGKEEEAFLEGLKSVRQALEKGYTPFSEPNTREGASGSEVPMGLLNLLLLNLILSPLVALFVVLPFYWSLRGKPLLTRTLLVEYHSPRTLGCLFTLFPLTFIAWVWWRKKLMKNLLTKLEICPQCGSFPSKIIKGLETLNDLPDSKALEVSLGSRKALGQLCEVCAFRDVQTIPNPMTSYEKCPSCGLLTYHQISKNISSSSFSLIYKCEHCSRRDVHPHHNTPSSPIWRGRSVGRIGPFRGGGSWGGGRSGGGGATSRF